MNNDFDFSDADEQFDPCALIPDGTFVNLTIVLCSESSDGLTQSKTGSAKYLKFELTVIDGKFNNKKFFQYFVVSGGKCDSNGNSIAGNISRSTFRAILESARNIKANDSSDMAIKARQIKSYFDFDGMNFVAEMGIKKAQKESEYSDQNKIKKIITPDMKEYAIIKSGQEVQVNTESGETKNTTPTDTEWGETVNKEETVTDQPQDDSFPPDNDDDVPDWAK